MTSVRLAPHLYDLEVALDGRSLAGQKVSPKEVKTLIAPHADKLRTDPAYRARVEALIAPEGGQVTARAKKPLTELLAANPATQVVKVKVTGVPSYSPGVGIRPPEELREPGRIYGPHVRLTAVLPSRGVSPLAEVKNDGRPGQVRVNGRNVDVVGTLTVYLKGEEHPGLPNARRPIEQVVEFPAPLIAAVNDAGLGGRYGLVVRDGRAGHEGTVLKATTFRVGGLPM